MVDGSAGKTGVVLNTQKWIETFDMLQGGGLADRGSHFALTVATLKRKGDDLYSQIEAMRLAENSLLQAARDEVEEAKAKGGAGAGPKDAKQAKTWGVALASAVCEQAREITEDEIDDDNPQAATRTALDSQAQVTNTLQAHRRASEEAEAKAFSEAQQVMFMQAQAVAQAQAMAEEQANALKQAQAQAEAVAQMQAQLQAQANMAEEQHAETDAQVAERTALRAQGLNSKKLPLRPSVPQCSFFMRTGDCKYGRNCKWDHPENSVNTKGYPVRPGETPCAFYLRTGECKFSNTCKFDHPEKVTPQMVAAVSGGTLGVPGALDAQGIAALFGTAPPPGGMPAPPSEPPPPGSVAHAAAVAAVQAAAAAVVQQNGGMTAQPPPPPGLPAGMAGVLPGALPGLGGLDPALQQLIQQQDEANKQAQAQSISEPLSEEQERLLTMLLQQAQTDLNNSLSGVAAPA